MANFADNFGANEWLVDEMFEKFKQDPNSVDKTWWEFFKDYSPQTPAGKPLNTNGGNLGTLASAPKGGIPPAPKSASSSESPFAKDVPIAPTQVGNGVHNPGATIPAHTPVTPSNTNQPAATHQTPNPSVAVPPVANPSVNPTAPRISSSATPADPVVKPKIGRAHV